MQKTCFLCYNDQNIGKINPVLFKIPLFGWDFWKKPIQTQENLFSNFLFKVSAESELLGPNF